VRIEEKVEAVRHRLQERSASRLEAGQKSLPAPLPCRGSKPLQSKISLLGKDIEVTFEEDKPEDEAEAEPEGEDCPAQPEKPGKDCEKAASELSASELGRHPLNWGQLWSPSLVDLAEAQVHVDQADERDAAEEEEWNVAPRRIEFDLDTSNERLMAP